MSKYVQRTIKAISINGKLLQMTDDGLHYNISKINNTGFFGAYMDYEDASEIFDDQLEVLRYEITGYED